MRPSSLIGVDAGVSPGPIIDESSFTKLNIRVDRCVPDLQIQTPDPERHQSCGRFVTLHRGEFDKVRGVFADLKDISLP
jgi:hypothetical protein